MIARYLTPLLTWVLCALLVLTPTLQKIAYAAPPPAPNPFDKAADEGQAFGKSHMPDPEELFGRDTGTGNFTIFPDSGQEMQIAPEDLFGTGHGTQSDIAGLYGDDDQINTSTGAAINRLKTESSTMGEAYRTLVESGDRYRPDYSNDPVFNATSMVMGDIFSGAYSACETTQTVTSTIETEHLPDYRFCNYVKSPDGECTIHHSYDADPIIEHVSGSSNMQTCPSGWNSGSYPASYGCLMIWLGDAGDDDYWSSEYGIYQHSSTYRILNPDAIVDVRVVETWWDDYMQFWVDGEKLWWAPAQNFPPDHESCNVDAHGNAYPNLDITSYFKSAAANKLITLKMRVLVCDIGEGYTRIRVIYDGADTLTLNKWDSTPLCEGMAKAAELPGVEGSVTCTQGSNSFGCIQLAGDKVCASWFPPTPQFDGISPLCERIHVEVKLNQGAMSCWEDPYGQTHCPVNTGQDPNGCQSLDNNDACALVSSECIEGAVLPNGQCFAFVSKYDCGYNVEVSTSDIENAYSCPGEVRCMGGDCLTIVTEENNNFAEVAAKLQAAEQIAMDMSCPEGTGTSSTIYSCKVFSGEKIECKTAVGGIVNCCEKPQSGISMTDYITLMRATKKVAGLTLGDTMLGKAMHGTWTQITEPITDAWSSVTDYFANALDANSAAVPLKKIGVAKFKQMALNQTAQLMADFFGKKAASLLFQQAGAVGGTLAFEGGKIVGNVQLAGWASSIIGVVTWAYTIYVVAKLIIQMVWKCTKKELELGVKRRLRTTYYIGSYCKTEVLGLCVEERRTFCVFSSPLSRILQEQLRAQLGIGWGSAEEPSCDGLSISQINSVDWSKVDLSEWIAILKTTGHMPSGPAEAMSAYSMDGVTGNIPGLNIGGTRDNVAERNRKRLSPGETGTRNKDLRRDLWDSVETGGYLP